MAIENLVISTIDEHFDKYMYNELVIGKLAHVDAKANVTKGQEVDVVMPATIDMFKYAGGDLPEA
mgnify:FL=1